MLIGVMSFFADFTYEGSPSIIGPYLAVLGASALVVGIVTGFGELLGYGLRLVSGRLSDQTDKYWPITIVGYIVQMTSVPLLALAGNWPVAALLMLLERVGKATRNPPRDVMLSHAAKEMGYGWAFGVHEALDQCGAPQGMIANLDSSNLSSYNELQGHNLVRQYSYHVHTQASYTSYGDEARLTPCADSLYHRRAGITRLVEVFLCLRGTMC